MTPKRRATTGVCLSTLLLAGFPSVVVAQGQAPDASRQWLRQVDDPKRAGLQMLKEGDLYSAKELLERAELEAPGDAAIVRGLAMTFYRLGRQELENDNSVEAGYWFDRAAAKDPTMPELWVGRGLAFYREGDLDKAVEALEKAESMHAEEATALLVRVRATRGTRRADIGDTPGADVDAQEALRRDPGDHETLQLLGRVRLLQKRPAEAVEPLSEARKDQRFRSAATLMLAQAYESLQRWEPAIAAADSIAEDAALRGDVDAVRARAYYNWGLEAFGKQQWATAEERFFAAVKYAPDWDDPAFSGALARLKQDNGEAAREVLKPLYERRPDYPGARAAYAEAEYQIGQHLTAAAQYDNAASTLRHAFELDPRRPEILLTLGATEERRSAWLSALDTYQLALKADGTLVEAHRGAMRVNDDALKRPLEAVPHADAILALKPGDADALARLRRITRSEGELAAARGDDRMATSLLSRHRQLAGGDDALDLLLARSHYRLLDFGAAAALVEPLVQANPRDPVRADLAMAVWIGLGDEASLTRDWGTAKVRYAQALAVDPKRHAVRYRYGVALLRLGEFADATAALRIVWTEAPARRQRTARPLAMALSGWADEQTPTAPQQAVALATEAIDRDATYAPGWLIRSEAYEKLHDLDRAIPDAEQYVKREAGDPDGVVWLAGLYRRGMVEAMDTQRFVVAEARARGLLGLRPADFDGVYWLGRALFAQDRWAESRTWLEQAAAEGPHRAPAYVYLARGTRAKSNDPETAAKFYLAAARIDPKAAPVDEQVATFRAAATVADQAQRYEDVVQYYNYAFLLVPGDPDIAYLYGKSLVRVKRAADALPHLRKAHALWPDRRDVAVDYAKALMQTEQPLLAVVPLQKWEQPDQKDFGEIRDLAGAAFLQAAAASLVDGELELAASSAVQAAERLPDKNEAWYVLGVIRYQQKQLDGALQALLKAQALTPGYKNTPKMLGDIYIQNGFAAVERKQAAAARAAFVESQRYLPDAIEALYGLVLVAELEKQPERMLEAIAAIEVKQPGYRDVIARKATAFMQLGVRAYSIGQYTRAAGYLQQAKALQPEAPEIDYYLGAVDVAVKSFATAIVQLEHAQEKLGADYQKLRPLLIDAYRVEIQRAMGQGQIDLALERIEKSLRLEPDQPNVLVWKGNIHEEREDWQDAAAAYYQALKLPGLDPKLRAIVEQLIGALPQNQVKPAPR